MKMSAHELLAKNLTYEARKTIVKQIEKDAPGGMTGEILAKRLVWITFADRLSNGRYTIDKIPCPFGGYFQYAIITSSADYAINEKGNKIYFDEEVEICRKYGLITALEPN